MHRLPDLAYDRLSTAQRKVHDAIAAGPRGTVEGPLKVWLHSPELADRAQQLGAYCRYGTSLPKRLSELAILMTGAFWKAGFEWYVHAPIGIEAGLDRNAVEAIRMGMKPAFARNDEAVVYDFVRELLEQRRVSDAVYRRAVDELGNLGVVDLVGILGYYGLISMTIVAFMLPVPDGIPEPFADRPNKGAE
jgi:4-carboxymuconolactone decarboxylase